MIGQSRKKWKKQNSPGDSINNRNEYLLNHLIQRFLRMVDSSSNGFGQTPAPAGWFFKGLDFLLLFIRTGHGLGFF